jgi:hypothetical protein
MNFLMHRQFAAREIGSSAAGLGAMLPDLWRMADRRMRGKLDVDDDVDDVVAGVRHHHDADAWFHKTAVFVDGEADTAAAFRAACTGIAKLGLFAHIAWELCLDGALVRREGLEGIIEALEVDFRQHAAAQRRAADLCGAARRLGEDRGVFEARMARIREQLTLGPWIAGYRDGDGLAARIAGLMMRVGLPTPSRSQLGALGEVMAERASVADHALVRLIADRAMTDRGN